MERLSNEELKKIKVLRAYEIVASTIEHPVFDKGEKEMTTHRYKRCIHCGIVYAYQGSGYGCNRPENSATYCSDCAVIAAKAIQDAFKDIPIKRKRVYVETEEVTCQELLEYRECKIEEVKKAGKLWMERVVSNLHDMKEPGNINHVYVIKYNDRVYHLSYWTRDNVTLDKISIRVEMELNIETGVTIPWDLRGIVNESHNWIGSY